MKMKRLVSTLLAGAMALSLVACGATEAPAATTEAPAAETKTEEAAPAPADTTAEATTSDAITLDMWCIATESDSNRHAYEAAIADISSSTKSMRRNRNIP